RVSWVHITYSWCDRFTQHSRTLVGWVERSRNPTQSARLGVIKFLSGFLGSYNLLICWVYGVHPTYSWCDRFTQHTPLGWERDRFVSRSYHRA
ncbi:hypothetical protein, partial [Limnospira sp. PMC 917.15]